MGSRRMRSLTFRRDRRATPGWPSGPRWQDGCSRSAAADGAAEAIAAPYTPGSGPGAWVPTPPALRPALDPGWGNVAPFLLRTPSQFRPGPPPALTSRQYTADFLEIRELGSATSTRRTAEQTALARLWVSTAPQVWNGVARQLIIARGLGPARAARVLALLHLAMADAFIAGWDAKYTYSQWRPVTGIPAADGGGNSQTPGTPGWTPLLVTPPFPDYPAAHAVCAGAAELVLARLFGPNPGIPLELTSPTAPGVVVHASNLGEIARGVLDARVWGGVHWRTSCDEGWRMGRRIGRLGAQRFLRPVGAKESNRGPGRDGLSQTLHPRRRRPLTRLRRNARRPRRETARRPCRGPLPRLRPPGP